MTALELQCAAILRAASEAHVGIVVHTNDVARARAMFYRVRKLLGDTTLDQLSIRVSPDGPDNELWIIRNASQLLDLKAMDITDA